MAATASPFQQKGGTSPFLDRLHEKRHTVSSNGIVNCYASQVRCRESLLSKIFLFECLFVGSVLLGLGFCGIGLLLPFAGTSRFWVLGAPFAGMLMVPLGANAFYSILNLPYRVAALISVICCVALAAVNVVVARPKLEFRIQPLTAMAVSAGIVFTVAAAVIAYDSATLHSRGPALLYVWGTDHGGYAHLADWLNTHKVHALPALNPSADRPYESWPSWMHVLDPRFGSLGLLAIVSTLKGTSGLFAYDVACAIIVTAAVLGLAALVAETLTVLCLVGIGLFVSHWIDYAHIGFFGKVFGYPAILFIAGLSLNIRRGVTLDRIVSLILLASGAGIAHSGPAASLLCGAIFGAALTAQSIVERDRSAVHPAAVLFCVVTLIPIIASGLPARPTWFQFPDWRLDWNFELPRMLDLESQGGSVTTLTPGTLSVMVMIGLLVWASLLAIAFRERNICAIGMLGGSALLLVALFSLNARAAAFQLIGFYYPALICGAGYLLVVPLSKQKIVLVLALIAVGERVPRFWGIVNSYVLHPAAEYTFSKLEFDGMAAALGADGVVEVDVANPQRAIAVLVEFGERAVNVQWTPRAWKTILGYRPWAPPIYTVRPTFVLSDGAEPASPGEIVWQSIRYRLTRLDPSQ
jgi:hypothetical protein